VCAEPVRVERRPGTGSSGIERRRRRAVRAARPRTLRGLSGVGRGTRPAALSSRVCLQRLLRRPAQLSALSNVHHQLLRRHSIFLRARSRLCNLTVVAETDVVTMRNIGQYCRLVTSFFIGGDPVPPPSFPFSPPSFPPLSFTNLPSLSLLPSLPLLSLPLPLKSS